MAEDRMKIWIYTCGDAENGMGHIIRQMTLADELIRRGADVTFETPRDTPGYSRLLKDRYRVETFPNGGADCLIVDVEHGPSRRWLETVRPQYPRVIVIGGVGFALDDPTALGSPLVDMQIHQSILCDDGITTNLIAGVDYVMVRPEFAECVPDYERGSVIVAFGGADPHQLTEMAAGALAEIGHNVLLITGPARPPLSGLLADNCEIIHAPNSLLYLLGGASLAIVATGMTAYEAYAAGVGTLLTNWSTDHERTAVELERRGCAWNMGQWHEFNGDVLRARVLHLLAHPEERAHMGAAGRGLIDGRGVGRVAEKIMAGINDQS